MRKLFWIAGLALLAACNQGGGPAGTLTMDWQPLVAATGPDGTDGPITLTGTLEGNPPGTLELQLAYRPKGGGWGPWQTVAQLQVQGNRVQATIPALDLPVGLDGLGKQVRARVAAGGQTLAQSGDYTLLRYRPLWSYTYSQEGRYLRELSAADGLVCGYYTAIPDTVFCLDPETGESRWTYLTPNNAGFVHDILVTEDGKVYVPQQNRVRVLQNGAQLAEYDLSSDFYYVTALAVEGDTLYVAGSRKVQVACGNTSRPIVRARLAKYQMSGGTLTQLALHDPTPQDLQEITASGDCSHIPYNYSSIPGLRLEGGKLYAVFSIGDVRRVDTSPGFLESSHCVGFLRLDAATFTRDWLTRPTRPGANGESTWQRDCPGSSWSLAGMYFWINSLDSFSCAGACPAVHTGAANLELGDGQLYAAALGQEVLRKEDGAKETLPGEDPYLLFLPGGFVRFGVVGASLQTRPGGTEGPYLLQGFLPSPPPPDLFSQVGFYRDAQGRVYAWRMGKVFRLR